MRLTTLLLPAAVLAATVLAATPSAAQIPQMMNYQVMLTDSADQPLADQAVALVFRIYDDPSAGTQQWTETHNVTTNSIGVVSVILGETTPLPVASFDEALWLEVQANGEILLPRRKLVSAPYALHAIESDSSGETGDGHSLDASDGSPVDAVYVNAAGDVGIGTTSPVRDVQVHGADQSKLKFTNPTTGATGSDGLDIGAQSDGSASIWNNESTNLVLGSGNKPMMTIDPSSAIKVGGASTWTGKLEIYRTGAATAVLDCSSAATGGAVTARDETGSTAVLISADDSGTGGLVHVSKDATYDVDEGIDLNGNWAGAEQPALRVIGTDRSAGFYMGSSANASVLLPVDAIGSTETLSEPGVARNENGVAIPLTGGVDVLTSRSITVPSAGYVLALGTCAVLADHTNTYVSTCRIAVSSTTSLPIGQYVWCQVPEAAPTGNYYSIVTVHDLFEVAAPATYTYYFLADEGGGDITTDSAILTLAYFPTAYGTVELAGRDGDDDALGLPLTPADIAAEQAEAREFNLARVERELAEIRAEVEAMKAEPGAARSPTAVEPPRAEPVAQPAAVLSGPSVEAN